MNKDKNEGMNEGMNEDKNTDAGINQKGFTDTGNWYKGNLHSHTTNSDGKLTPGESVALYQGMGYHFLCLSEHDCYTDSREEFNTEDFIILPGLEASALLINDESHLYCKKVHHIHGILGSSKVQEEATSKGLEHMQRLEVPRHYGRTAWTNAIFL